MTESVVSLEEGLDDAFYRELVDQSLDVVTVLDGDGVVRFLSPSFTPTFGHDRADVIGRSVFDFLHDADIAVVLEALGRITEGEQDRERVEVRFSHADGGWRWIEAVGRVWTHRGERYTLVNSRDISERLRLEREREHTNELLSKMLQASRDVISVTDLATGRLVEVNDAWLELAGYTREEAIGRTATELGLWGDGAGRERMMADLEAAGGRLTDYPATTFTRAHGSRQLVLNVEHLEIGDSPLILNVASDRTDANLTEAKLRQAQRMEAVGQLTGGVAHDFNNLLGIILGNADLLRESLVDGSEARELVDLIVQAAERGAGVTRQLLAFARKQTLDPRPVRVCEALGHMLPLFRTTLGANIDVVLDCGDDLPPAFVDEGELETAVLNLVVNARDAMPEGGRLRLAVARTTVDGADGPAGEELKAGEYLAIEVEDTGVGMEPETAARVFEPFFTTKAAGRGTGLGLSMVFGFARQTGGHVRVRSERGVGTCVTLLLPPAAATETAAEEVPPPVQTPAARGETVLVLEDEEGLRRLLRRMLEHLGYRVLEAADEATLETLLAGGERFDVLLSDVQLTGPRQGPELAARVVGARPDVRVVFMTGYADERVVPVLDQPLRVLHKPFGREDLAGTLREAIEDRTP
jgi:PAS domain S-box-containing protein